MSDEKIPENKLLTVYDFNMPSEEIRYEDVIKSLDTFAREWTFQHEKGATGYLHFQGRFKLGVRKRFSTMKNFKPKCFEKVQWSPTSNKNKGNNFYVMKPETRVAGPWSSNDAPPPFIPRQISSIKRLFPFQKTIMNSCSIYEPRIINILINVNGNEGKSIICQYLDVHELAVMVPSINDYKDMIQYCMCRRKTPAYLIDLPRAMKKEKLGSFYSAIETLKSGFLFDLRYKGHVKHIDRPVVWVFTNTMPDINNLSLDMWRFWKIENKKLVKLDQIGIDISFIEKYGNLDERTD